MRHIIELKDGWQFTNLDGQTSEVSIPHTWNAVSYTHLTLPTTPYV